MIYFAGLLGTGHVRTEQCKVVGQLTGGCGCIGLGCTGCAGADALDWWLLMHTGLHRLCRVVGHRTNGCGYTGLVCMGLCRAAGVLGCTGAGVTGLVTGVVAAQGQGLMARFSAAIGLRLVTAVKAVLEVMV